jgi:hypothetical protein
MQFITTKDRKMKKTLAISLIFAVLSICGCTDEDKKPNQNGAGPAYSGETVKTLEDCCAREGKDYDADRLKEEFGVIDPKMVEHIQSELTKDCLDKYEHFPFCKEETIAFEICFANINEAQYLEVIEPVTLKCENVKKLCEDECDKLGSEEEKNACNNKCEEDNYACFKKDHPCGEEIKKYDACDDQHHNDILSYEQSRKSEFNIIYDVIITDLCTEHAASFDAKYLKDGYDVTDPAIVEKIQKAIYSACYDYLDKYPNCGKFFIAEDLCETALTDAQQDEIKALKVKCEDDVYLPCESECQKLDSEEQLAACRDKCYDDENDCINKAHPCGEQMKKFETCRKDNNDVLNQYEASQKDYEDIITEIINAPN